MHPNDSIQCLTFDHRLLAYGTCSGLVYVMQVRENRANEKGKEKERPLVEYTKLNAASVGKTEELKELNGVTCLGFSSGARYLSAGHGNGRILVWDLKTSAVIKEFYIVDSVEPEEADPRKGQSDSQSSSAIVSLAFSPSDSYLAATVDMKSALEEGQPSKTSCVYLFSIVSQRLVGKFHTRGSGTIRCIKFSPLRRSWLAAINDDGDVYVWDTTSKSSSGRRASPKAASQTTPTSSSSIIASLPHLMTAPGSGLSFHAVSSLHMLVAAASDGSIYFIDLNTKKVVRRLEVNKPVTSIKVISNSIVVTTGQGKIIVYSNIESLMNATNHDAKENRESHDSSSISVQSWQGHSSSIVAACLRPLVPSTSCLSELSTPKAMSKPSTSSKALGSKDGTPVKRGESGPREMARTPIKGVSAESTKEVCKSLDEELFSPLEDVNKDKEIAMAPQQVAAAAAPPAKPVKQETVKKKRTEKMVNALISDLKAADKRASGEARPPNDIPVIRSLNEELSCQASGYEKPQKESSSVAQPSLIDQKSRPVQPETVNLRRISEVGPQTDICLIRSRNLDVTSQAALDMLRTSLSSAAEPCSKEDKNKAMKSESVNAGRTLSVVSSSSLSSTSPGNVITTPATAHVGPTPSTDLPKLAMGSRISTLFQASDSSKAGSPSDQNLTPKTAVSVDAEVVLSSEELAKISALVLQIVRQELEPIREEIRTSLKSMHLDLIRNSARLESQIEQLAEQQLHIDSKLAKMESTLQSTNPRRVFHM